MAKTRITTKGQVTIPKEVRERLGLRPGDELEFTEEDGVFRLKKRLLKRYRGYLKEFAKREPRRACRRAAWAVITAADTNISWTAGAAHGDASEQASFRHTSTTLVAVEGTLYLNRRGTWLRKKSEPVNINAQGPDPAPS